MAKNQKRMQQLDERSKFESFYFQLEFIAKQCGLEIDMNNSVLRSELEIVRSASLMSGFLKLQEMLTTVKNELDIMPTEDSPELAGSTISYIFGITQAPPIPDNPLTTFAYDGKPLQITLRFTTDDRIRLVKWFEANATNCTLTTRLGQPLLKLQNINVELKRIVIND